MPEVTNVQDWLLWRSTISPHKLALKFGSVQWSYEKLQEVVSNLSGLLLSWGVKRRDRVALLLNSSEMYIALVHALGRIKAVTVPLHVRQSPSELLRQINDCDPSLILYDPIFSDISRRIEEASKDRAFRWRRSTELKNHSGCKPVKGKSMNASFLHSIIYTSGSTGTPKGVEITVSNLLWNAISFGIRHSASSSDRWLLAMPLSHVGGYAIIFRSVLHGSAIVLHPRFEASAVSASIDRDGITLVSLVPTMLRRLLQVTRKPFPPRLRLVFLGGAPLPSHLVGAILDKRLPVLLTYGMTETCSQVAIYPVDSQMNTDEIFFRVMFPTTMAIKDGEAFTSRARRVGEILVRGPTIFRRYWRSPELTSSVFKNGWFHTGDLGFLDSEGRLVVLGRKEDMIISGGENIYPIEVESALLKHETIEDVVVIGREDQGWGQRLEAVVKVKRNFKPPSSSELTRFLGERIGGFKIPKAYHFWASIPETASGKAKREVVRELVERGEEWHPNTYKVEFK